MIDYDWKNEIHQWVENNNKAKPYLNNLVVFFEKAFVNTSFPDKVFFGTNNYSISLLSGGVYFAAYRKLGDIWLLLDKYVDDIPKLDCSIALCTKKFHKPLYWLNSSDLNNLQILTNREDIWSSFKVATERIYENKSITAYKESTAKYKISLISFYPKHNQTLNTKSVKEIESELYEKVKKVKRLSENQIQDKLPNKGYKPATKIVNQTVYDRNTYVIAKVLNRANGICEHCKREAPFLRDNDNSPYLEVHHKIPLAEGGNDTVDNAIALCPNCHRHAHYGESTYNILKLK